MLPLLGSRAILLAGVALNLPNVGALTGLALLDFVAAGALTIHVVQRAAGTTFRNTQIAFTWLGGSPTSIEARVTRKDTGAVVVGWTALTAVTLVAGAGGGAGVGTLAAVPQGGPYLVQIRDGITKPASGALFSAGAQAWGVGPIIYVGGQSQNQATFSSGIYTGATPIAGTSDNEGSWWAAGKTPAGIFDTAGWHGPSNQGVIDTLPDHWMTFMRLVTMALKDAVGAIVPVGFMPWWINGSSISVHLPGSYLFTHLFQGSGSVSPNIGMASGEPFCGGDFETALWCQGQSDAGGGRAAYQTQLATLYQAWLSAVAPYGRTGNTLKARIACVDLAAGQPLVEGIREAELRFCRDDASAQGWGGVSLGWVCTDLPNDGLHIVDDNVRIRFVRRAAQAAMHAIGAAPYGAGGSRITGAVRTSPTNIRLTIAHDGGTALQGATGSTGLTGFYLNGATDFSGTDYAITAAGIFDATHIDLTVASTVPAGVAFKYLGKRPGYAGGPDDYASAVGVSATNAAIANPVYDNARYPYWTNKANTYEEEALGLPLQPTAGAIVVA